MHRLKRIFVVAVALFMSHISFAAVYKIDTGHSQVGFGIRHLVSKTKGSFKQFAGSVDFDEKDLSKLKVDAIIQTASVDTNEPKRDAHLKSTDFFNVEKFPTMTFKSTSVKKISDSKAQVTGDLTLLGVTKPVTLDVEYTGMQNDPWGGTRTGFSATGKLNRKDFGMVFNMTVDKGGLLLGDDVDLTIDVEGVKQK